MSYDITLRYPEAEEKVFEYNITYNLAELFRRALKDEEGVWSLTGRSGRQAEDTLNAAIHRMVLAAGYYQQFQPHNGWGTYGDALEFFRATLEAAKQHPDAVFHVS